MAYEKVLRRTATISSPGDSVIDSSGVTVGFDTRYNVYYYAITFGQSGVATFSVTQSVFPGETGRIYVDGWVGLTDDLNTSTGKPVSITKEKTYLDDSPLQIAVSARTYYFWWRQQDTKNGVVVATIRLESNTNYWTANNPTNVGSITEPWTNRSDPTTLQPRTLDSFSVRVGNGNLTFQSSNSATRIYITRYPSDIQNAYDLSTGIPYNILAESSSGGPTTVSVTSGRYLCWIRLTNASDPADTAYVTITPPGSEWTRSAFDDPTAVTTNGVTWNGVASDLPTKVVRYVQLNFSTAGTYIFSSTTGDTLYGYLTTSIGIDADGKPDVSTTVAKNEPSYGGFSFSADVSSSTGMSLWLMFRTDDGDPAQTSFTISIQYSVPVGDWTLDTPEYLGPLSDNYQSYHNYGDTYTLYKKVVRFAHTTRVNFYSTVSPSSSNPTYPKAWITSHEIDTAYDRVNGGPPPSATVYASDSNSSGNRQFSIQGCQVQAGVYYDFWFRSCDPDGIGYGWIHIDLLDNWSLDDRTSDSSLSNLSSNVIAKQCPINAAHLAKYAVTFEYTGTATFTTDGGSSSSWAYLCAVDNDYDHYSGEPISPVAYDVDGGFVSMSYAVNAGTTYYLWLRAPDDVSSGVVQLNIEVPPEFQWSYTRRVNVRVTSSDVLLRDSLYEHVGNLYRLEFSASGRTTISDSSSLKTSGFINPTDNSYSQVTGIPNSYDASGGLDGDDNGFEFRYRVTSGEYYYLWVKGRRPEVAGNESVTITLPTHGASVSCWVWDGSTWVEVMPYVYNGSSWEETEIHIYTGSSWTE